MQKGLRKQYFLWQLFHLDKDLEASRAEVGRLGTFDARMYPAGLCNP